MAVSTFFCDASAQDGYEDISANAGSGQTDSTNAIFQSPSQGDRICIIFSGVGATVGVGSTVSDAFSHAFAAGGVQDTPNQHIVAMELDDGTPADITEGVNHDLTDRPVTTNTHSWGDGTDLTLGNGDEVAIGTDDAGGDPTANPADLTNMVQECIDGTGWGSSSRLAMMITKNTAAGGNIGFRGFDNAPSLEAFITITYTAGGGGAATVPVIARLGRGLPRGLSRARV